MKWRVLTVRSVEKMNTLQNGLIILWELTCLVGLLWKTAMSANMIIHTGSYFFQQHWAAESNIDLEPRLQYAPWWGSLKKLREGFNPRFDLERLSGYATNYY